MNFLFRAAIFSCFYVRGLQVSVGGLVLGSVSAQTGRLQMYGHMDWIVRSLFWFGF